MVFRGQEILMLGLFPKRFKESELTNHIITSHHFMWVVFHSIKGGFFIKKKTKIIRREDN